MTKKLFAIAVMLCIAVSLLSGCFLDKDAKNATYIHNQFKGDGSDLSAEEPLEQITISGNFYQLLKDIHALANNSHLPSAMGSTAFGAPTTWVNNLSIAGK